MSRASAPPGSFTPATSATAPLADSQRLRIHAAGGGWRHVRDHAVLARDRARRGNRQGTLELRSAARPHGIGQPVHQSRRGVLDRRHGSGAIFLGTLDGRLFSIVAETGKPDDAFGMGGWIDLREGVAEKLSRAPHAA